MLQLISEPAEGMSADTLGGKGYGLVRMLAAGIPVPLAYIITTDECREYMDNPAIVMNRVKMYYITGIVKDLTAKFGYMPLVSVRSAGKVSMPGMLDTILNIGLTKKNFAEWVKRRNKACMLSCQEELDKAYTKVVGAALPDTVEGQLAGAIEAVFKSWNNERAVTFRNMKGIPHDGGTAVIIQVMVFGNLNDKSCTGVAFSRNPSTGANEIIGEFLPKAQGEAVVNSGATGSKAVLPLSEMNSWNMKNAQDLMQVMVKLEKMESDMVDVEFTVQDGELFILQVRPDKQRSGAAAVRVAVDLYAEHMIDLHTAVTRVTRKQLEAAARVSVNEAWVKMNPAHGNGIGASNGCVTGVAVFSAEAAVNCKEPCILVVEQTDVEDVEGMGAAAGIFTKTGGFTCHAALVARGLEKVCVVGCDALTPYMTGGWVLGGERITAGTRITLDGLTGRVWVNKDVPMVGGLGGGYVSRFLSLLCQYHNVHKVCTVKEDMLGAEKILLSTCMLDRKLTGSELRDAMIELLSATKNVQEVVVDLRCIQEVAREGDVPVEFIWGELQSVADAKQAKLAAFGFSDHGPLKVLGLGLSASDLQDLETTKIAVLPAVKTLHDLIHVNGLCTADFNALAGQVSKEDALEIVKLKKLAGHDVRSFNIVEKVEAGQLGRNAVFALSGIEAAQCLLAA